MFLLNVYDLFYPSPPPPECQEPILGWVGAADID
jgi:hypothetical protein